MIPTSRVVLVLLGVLLAVLVPIVPSVPAQPTACITFSNVPCPFVCEAGEMIWIGLSGPGTLSFNGCGLSASVTCPGQCSAHIGYATAGVATCVSDGAVGVCERAWMCPPTCGVI